MLNDQNLGDLKNLIKLSNEIFKKSELLNFETHKQSIVDVMKKYIRVISEIEGAICIFKYEDIANCQSYDLPNIDIKNFNQLEVNIYMLCQKGKITAKYLIPLTTDVLNLIEERS